MTVAAIGKAGRNRSRAARPIEALVAMALVAVSLAIASCGGTDSDSGTGSGRATGAEPFDNLVLITIDTLRADHLGCYGYPRPVSPFLDGLAANGVRFDETIASSSHTAPSHASIFTSQYPARHRVLRNGNRLRATVPTLARILAGEGFETAGFTAMGFLKTIARGFTTWDSVRGLPYRPADVMTDLALEWYAQKDQEQRFFLWVHFYDVHNSGVEYLIPEPWFSRMQEDSSARQEELDGYWARELGLPADRIEEYRPRYDHYDAQIAFVDVNLRRLFEGIGAGTPENRTLWVITADHGEGLGMHDFFGHGKYLYQEQLRVPLLFFGGDDWVRPGVVEQMVRHVDLLPTLTELLGVEIDVEALTLEGRSLVPLLHRPDVPLKIDVAVSHRRPADRGNPRPGWLPGLVLSATTERYKYILRSEAEDELYDLEADPFETENLIGQGLEIENQLGSWLAHKYQLMLENPLVGTPSHPEIESEYIEDLEALGYLN